MKWQLQSRQGWPNHSQRLVLRTALLDGDTALDAWQRWNRQNEIEAIDTASFFILPQVYLSLKKFGNDVPKLGRLKGVYRWTWSQNQLTLGGLIEVLRLFEERQRSAIVLKGVPLALQYYRDLGARMMKDADLLVDVEDLPKVIADLGEISWRQEKPRAPDHLMPFLEGLHFTHPQWNRVDIQWRPFRLDTPPSAERGLWNRSQDDAIRGVSTRVPSATDLLLLTCFHGRKSDIHSTCRWIVDAMVLLRESHRSIDWDQLLEWTRQLGLLLPVRDALSYLHGEFAAPIPTDTLEHAWSLPTCRTDEDRYDQMIQHGLQPSIRGVVEEHWARYGDVCRLREWDADMLGFLRYFLSHCRREIRSGSARDLTKRFLGGRRSLS